MIAGIKHSFLVPGQNLILLALIWLDNVRTTSETFLPRSRSGFTGGPRLVRFHLVQFPKAKKELKKGMLEIQKS